MCHIQDVQKGFIIAQENNKTSQFIVPILANNYLMK